MSTDHSTSPDRILNHLTRARRPLKIRELAKEIGVSQAEYPSFRILVRELESEGKLVRLRGNRFTAPERLNLIVGKLSVPSSRDGGFGFVIREDGPDLFIPAAGIGSAMHGDRVAARIVRKGRGSGSPEGEIVRILERAFQTVVGIYRERQRFGFVEPDDRKIPWDIYVKIDNAMGAREGQKVMVRVESWSPRPSGRIEEVLGYPGDPGVDILSIAIGYGLRTEFPADAQEEAEQISEGISEEESTRRRDLRDTLCLTIDPEEARDFDDAVSLTAGDDGTFLLGVHISDVAFYIQDGSALDREALLRGNSTYLVDRVLPMLPGRLSGHLCCLKPEEDRPTMSVLAQLDSRGEALGYEIVPSLIRSRARLSYKEAQALVENAPVREEIRDLRETLQAMYGLSRLLIGRRRNRGAIDFNLPEARVELDPTGRPIDVYRTERLDSHRIIEEFMLLANELVADHLDRLSVPFLYRVHDTPDPAKLAEFATFARSLGHPFRTKKRIGPEEIQQFLRTIRGRPGEAVIVDLLLRAMRLAVYSPKNLGHFGLACPKYTHFTSPIRRYPDLLLHRLLRELHGGHLDEERRTELSGKLPALGDHLSERERASAEAERETMRMKQAEFMEDRVGELFWGVISGIRKFGIFVKLEDTLIEGLIHVRDLKGDHYTYDDRQYCLIGRRTGRRFRMGDRIRVRAVRADKEARQVDFVLA